MKTLLLSNPHRRRRRKSRSRSRRRRTSRRAIMRNPHRRRRGGRRRRSGGGGGGISLAGIKGAFNRENLMLAGGIAGGSLLGLWLTRQTFWTRLPGQFKADGVTPNPIANIAYGVGIPLIAGLAVRRFSPKLGTGMVLGSVSTAVLAAVNMAGVTAAISGTAAATQGEYFEGPGYRLGYDRGLSYRQARNLTGLVGASPYDSGKLVTKSAW